MATKNNATEAEWLAARKRPCPACLAKSGEACSVNIGGGKFQHRYRKNYMTVHHTARYVEVKNATKS